MNMTTTIMTLLLGVLPAGHALAQQAPDCPPLPVSSGMHWESRVANGTAFCRALLADGSEAFGLYVSSEAGFTPRDPNRIEQGSLNGQAVLWYRTEIAATPGVDSREAAVRLGDDLYIHAWLQTSSREDLAARLRVLSRLRFNSMQLAGGQ